MNISTYRQSGLTLVELLIAMTITGLLFIGLATFTASYLENNATKSAQSQLLTDNIAILDQITEDIRQASGADEDNRYSDSYAPGGAYGWHSDESTLVLATIAQDASQDVIFEDEVQYIPAKNNIVYFVSSNALYRRVLAGPMTGNAATTTCPPAETTCPADRTLSTNVSSFSLRYLDADDAEVVPSDARSVEVTLGLAMTKRGQLITTEHTVRTVFRN